MEHDKYSTWNKKIWHPQKIMLYKNSTPCKKVPKRCLDWAEWFLKEISLICSMIQASSFGISKSSFYHSRVITSITLVRKPIILL